MTFSLIFTFPRSFVRIVPDSGQNAVPAIFSCAFAFMFVYRAKFFSRPFLFLPKIRSLGCDEIIMTFHFALSCRNHVYSRIQNQFWVTRYPKFLPVFDFKAHFYLNSHTHVVMISLQLL